VLRGRLSGLAAPEAIENPPDKRAPFNFTAAAWAVAALALALRLAYAWRLGAPVPWLSVVSSALTTFALAALGLRLAGPLAGAAAAFIWAVLPVSIVAAIFHPSITYAAGAAAFSLYLFAEGEGRGGRVSELLWAGALAGAAAALSASALPLVAYYLLFSLYRTFRKRGGTARAFAWLGGFVPVVAAAATLEYLRVGKLFAHLGTALAAPVPFRPEGALLLKRLVADAAAMLFWDPLGFGFAVVVALAAGVYYLRSRREDALFYGGLLVFALAAYNFAPTSLRGYAPAALEPTGWLLAALPAAALGGAVIGDLWRRGERDDLRRWTASLGLAVIVAILFVNGNMPYAPLGLAILALAVIITVALAGFARRRAEASPRRFARAAAAAAILISLYPVVIIYL
jgi:hypothetical protein